ncbi:hypothetical protein L1887_51552 [Cichorium endivia]|nr:hypothetical protein L1887_51552 [Cichorium endivia]
MRGRSPTLEPWLGLRARLILSPVSVAMIAVLFVGARVLMSASDVTDSVASTKTKLLAACDAVEDRASLAASLPSLTAATVNAQIAQSVEATVHGAARVFDLSLTAIEKTLAYMVNSYRSLLLCFMELLVRGALAVLISAVQLISQAVNAAAQGIRAAIQESVQGVNAVLATAVQGINDVVGVFGQHLNAPSIAVPSLAALQNVELPHEIQDGLVKLNETLPTLQQLRQTMNQLIQTPFEQMRKDVNATIAGFSFNHTMLPVPQMQNLSFCQKIDTSPIDRLGRELAVAARWALAMLAVVALAVVLVSAAREWCAWHKEQQGIKRTTALWHTQQQHSYTEKDDRQSSGKELGEDDVRRLVSISRSPLAHSLISGASRRLGVRSRWAQDRLLWLGALLSHPAALACLFTGLLGLLCVWVQTLLIRRITHRYTSELDDTLTHLSSEVLGLVESSARNASVAFATTANALITEVSDELNTHVFRWVDTTTLTMNATLNQFVDGITDTLTTTFGGTPFNAPLQTFVQCILGQKVAGIEKALTWIHNNAHVEFSLVPDHVFVPSALQKDVVLHPIRSALVGDGKDGSGLAGQVVGKYLHHLEQEKVLFAVLTAVWAIVAAGGILVVVYATIADGRHVQKGEGEAAGGDAEKPRGPTSTGPGWLRFPTRSQRSNRTASDEGQQMQVAVVADAGRSVRGGSIVDSARMAGRGHIAKDSISYPFQIHRSLSTAVQSSSPRLANSPLSAQDAASPPYHRDAMDTPTPRERSSWLSFLIAHSTAESSQPRHADPVAETAQDRFERLFGCSPASSPTSPAFQELTVAPLAEGPRHRQTLDLLPAQDWIGSKSPVPQPGNRGAEEQGFGSRDETVELVRASRGVEVEVAQADSYPHEARRAELVRQQRQPSAQSMSFYAW